MERRDAAGRAEPGAGRRLHERVVDARRRRDGAAGVQAAQVHEGQGDDVGGAAAGGRPKRHVGAVPEPVVDVHCEGGEFAAAGGRQGAVAAEDDVF